MASVDWRRWAAAPLRHLRWRFWVTFLLACAVAEGGEFLFEHLLSSGDRPALAESLVTATGLYQRLVTARRHPIERFTAIVEIDPRNDSLPVSDANVCAERDFLAHLLVRINSANPAMIVIDKYFGQDTCPPPDDAGTKALIEAVDTARANRAIVVGSKTDTVAVSFAGGTTRQVPVLAPALSFGPDDKHFREGIVNISADNRRLPLQWLIYPSREAIAAGTRVVRDTFALSVAKLYDANLMEKSPRLSRLIANGEQPFIGFLDIHDFKWAHLYASELCDTPRHAPDQWRHCTSEQPPPEVLTHRIVLIGENDPDRDEFPSIVGRLPGFYLQANYIEALLDDRYYTPGGPWLDYGVAFLFLVALELILVVYHHDVIRIVFFCACLVVGSGIFLYLAIMLASVYIDPVAVSATAILIKLLHEVYGYVQRETPPTQMTDDG
jgi:hypothetical protein